MTAINDLFYLLLETKEVTLVLSVSEYESTRVQLTRKLTRYKEEMSKCGFLADWVKASSIKSSLSAKGEATYKLGAKRAPKEYTILRTGSSDETENSTVRTDLECNQDSEVRELDGDSCSQQHAEDSDPSSEEGEDSTLRRPPLDWGTNSWATGNESGSVPEEQGLSNHQL